MPPSPRARRETTDERAAAYSAAFSRACATRFDAPPGTGNDANRERISISTDAKGGASGRVFHRSLVA
jgi:hypothetical protein